MSSHKQPDDAPTQAAKRIKRSIVAAVAATAEAARPKLRRLSGGANFYILFSIRKFQFLARATCSESATWPATVAYPPASVVSTQPAVRTQ